jgi:hypothetical protein
MYCLTPNMLVSESNNTCSDGGAYRMILAPSSGKHPAWDYIDVSVGSDGKRYYTCKICGCCKPCQRVVTRWASHIACKSGGNLYIFLYCDTYQLIRDTCPKNMVLIRGAAYLHVSSIPEKYTHVCEQVRQMWCAGQPRYHTCGVLVNRGITHVVCWSTEVQHTCCAGTWSLAVWCYTWAL